MENGSEYFDVDWFRLVLGVLVQRAHCTFMPFYLFQFLHSNLSTLIWFDCFHFYLVFVFGLWLGSQIFHSFHSLNFGPNWTFRFHFGPFYIELLRSRWPVYSYNLADNLPFAIYHSSLSLILYQRCACSV